MTNRPSVPEIITVNSEGLQTQIRDLLPSQNGFGSELQASNVITPIIDLTRAAEGSTTSEILQTAISFGSQTEFNANNSTVVLANSPGFYKITFAYSIRTTSPTAPAASFTMTDGVSVKSVVNIELAATTNFAQTVGTDDITVFLGSGISISAVSNGSGVILSGSIRQIANSEGTLTPPSGFPL